MSIESVEHNIRVALGKALHRRRLDPEGAVDLEAIARENGVSEDQVREQIVWLRRQNLIGGPFQVTGEQVSHVPVENLDDVHLSDAGMDWAIAGYPRI